MKKLLLNILSFTPIAKHIIRTRNTAAPIKIGNYLIQKILGFNRAAYWPTHFTSKITNPQNIRIGVGTAPGLSHGCYIQGIGKIDIGDYTVIAPNVGIISANHDPGNITKHTNSKVSIGRYCWIGMNAVILPGVTLGDHTVVAAGAVVSKSFPEGFCILGGVPARVISRIDPEAVTEKTNSYEYIGYHPKQQ